MTDYRLDIHDLVDELTRSRTHRERYSLRESGTTWTRDHLTSVPSLIDQLQTATPASAGDGAPTGGYRSRPAAWLEALDTLVHIDLAAAHWVRDLGEDDPGDTGACIQLLHGLHASAPHCGRRAPRRDDAGKVICCTAHAIEADVRQWWTQARVITGWDSTAWRPANTCPMCGERGALRVRFSTQSAFCVQCRTTWDETQIGLLADHIRHENSDDIDDQHEEAS